MLKAIYEKAKSGVGKGLIGVGIIKVLNLALMLLLSVLLARTLKPTDYGSYSYTIALMTLLAVPVSTGLPTLVTREVARSMAKRDWGLMRGIIVSSNFFVILLSIALIMIFFLVWPGLDQLRQGQPYSNYNLAIFIIPLLALASLRVAVLKGLKKVLVSEAIDKILAPALLLVTIASIVFFEGYIDYSRAIKVYVLSGLCVFFVGVFYLRKHLPKELVKGRPRFELQSWARSIGPLSVFSAVVVAQSQVPIMLLGFFSNIEEVAMYRVASQLGGLVAFGMTTVNLVLAPYIAGLYSAGQLDKLQSMITAATRLTVACALPVLLILILWGEKIISILFGESYAAAYWSLAIIVFSQFVNGAYGVAGLLLNMSGYERQAMLAGVLGLTVNVTLGLFTIPMWGAPGAAFSILVSITVWSIMLHREALRRVGVNTFLF